MIHMIYRTDFRNLLCTVSIQNNFIKDLVRYAQKSVLTEKTEIWHSFNMSIYTVIKKNCLTGTFMIK